MENLVGVKVGTLYVIKQEDNKVYCYCSNCRNSNIEISVAKIQYFKNHHKENITCGCEIKSNHKQEHLINLGTTYNNLTVVKKLDNKEYECICKCGELVIIDENSLIRNMVGSCDKCKYEDDEAYLMIYNNKVKKELYYLWGLYHYLYKFPTPIFKRNIIDKDIKFFPEFEDNFDLFYEWAKQNDYREKGLIFLNRKDEEKDYSTDNCIFEETPSTKNDFIQIPKEILQDVSKENESVTENITIVEKGTLNQRDVEIARNENNKETIYNKNNLINYIQAHYGMNFIPKSLLLLLKQLNNGISEKYPYIMIEYDVMLDMLTFYQNELLSLYRSNLKKGNKLSPNQRVAYDISIMVDRFGEFMERRQAIQNMNSQCYPEDQLPNNSLYLNFNRPQKAPSEEAEMIEDMNRFIESLLREEEEEWERKHQELNNEEENKEV